MTHLLYTQVDVSFSVIGRRQQRCGGGFCVRFRMIEASPSMDSLLVLLVSLCSATGSSGASASASAATSSSATEGSSTVRLAESIWFKCPSNLVTSHRAGRLSWWWFCSSSTHRITAGRDGLTSSFPAWFSPLLRVQRIYQDLQHSTNKDT